MTNAEFDELVRRLESHAAASPRLYKLRVALLALLGYAYIGAILLVLAATIAGCAWAMIVSRTGNAALFKIALALLILASVIIRSLWVTFAPPSGRRLTAADAPTLFAEAEELRRAVRAPKADIVLLADDFNASVSQVPRLGIFGFPRNYLVVGLPLLESLPAGHVRAVLAHEFAHLSRAHGKFGSWIYRVRITWLQLVERFEQSGHRIAVIFTKFFSWYGPLFNAYAFVLVRRHEYEADRLAAEVVGRERMMQTLIDLEVRGQFLSSRFWPALWKEAEMRDIAPDDVYTRLAHAACTPIAREEGERWMASAFKRRTDTIDTHPALRDRVAALAGAPDGDALLASGRSTLAPSTQFDAPGAAHYLGASHARLAAEMGRSWQEDVQPSWTQRHGEVREIREGLTALAAKRASGEALSLEERWQQASWTEELHGADAAFPLYDALRREDPDHASANFALGRLLLARGDEGGIALLERVMAKDADAVLPACRIAYNYYAGEGRLEEADRWRERASERNALLAAAQQEREVITDKDRYHPAELAPEVVAALVAQLDTLAGVKRAYLARKELRHFAEESPLHVLAVVPRTRFWEVNLAKVLQRFNATLGTLQLPPNVNAYGVIGTQADGILRPIKKVKGSLLYVARKRKKERRGVQRYVSKNP
jgi:Zn-dependent protease with chaperone function